MEIIKETAEKIRKLEIQGATNIALAAIDSFFKFCLKERNSLKIDEAYRILKRSRPNEPLMQNLLRILYLNSKDLKKLKKTYYFVRSYIYTSQELISTIASRMVEDKDIIGTICHSSTVEFALKKAKDMGKNFTVWVSETRPRYQGRITAKKLSEYGIKVKFVVDGSIWRVVKNSKKIFIGADVLLQTGIINKVGTRILAKLAFLEDKPVYVLSQLLKYREEFERGIPEEIEMRDPREIWDFENENLEILNYAFDFVPKKYITAIISEAGVYSYEMVKYILEKKYKDLF